MSTQIIFSYVVNSTAILPIEGAFVGIKDQLVIFVSDDPSAPWMVLPTEAFLTAAERDGAIARGAKLLAALSPAPAKVAKPAKVAAPVAKPKAAAKVTAKAAVPVTKLPPVPAKGVKVTAKPKRSA